MSGTRCVRIFLGAKKISLSQAFAGPMVGIRQVAERVWLVSFMQYDLGYFDDETCRVESRGTLAAGVPFNNVVAR